MSDLEVEAPRANERARVRQRLEKKRSLETGFVAFVVVNAVFVALWAVTGGGYFWPAWIMGLWGAGMLLALWDFRRGPVTEADVDRELRER